jgi:hypothetical protein
MWDFSGLPHRFARSVEGKRKTSKGREKEKEKKREREARERRERRGKVHKIWEMGSRAVTG